MSLITDNTHFLYPSSLFASADPAFVSTILGSCVAICIYDPVLKIGGMNHFMLPLWNGQGLATPKYGNIANQKLIEKMISLGSNQRNLLAKVFGGGEVIEVEYSNFNIGLRNIEIALSSLKEMNIPVRGQSVGGKLGRKIMFNTFTGEVAMKFIQKTSVDNPSIKIDSTK